MAEYSTRGDLAYALYSALGLPAPTSTGRFTDGGYLDGITSTLADLGITNGISPTEYGTMKQTTRGEAFTMIARALGLADKSSSIAEASKALVDAGIVKGYGNNPNDLGLNDPLQKDHLAILFSPERFGALIDQPRDDGLTPRDVVHGKAVTATEEAVAKNDPAFAAYLISAGLRKDQIADALARHKDLFDVSTDRRKEVYTERTDSARQGINTDFENRGLFRSGTRKNEVFTAKEKLEAARRREQQAAEEAYNTARIQMEDEKARIEKDTAIREAEAKEREAARKAAEKY